MIAHGQSADERKILQLSARIFEWEIHNQFDSLQFFLDDNFKVVTSRGDVQTKKQYITTLQSGTISHDTIRIEHTEVTTTGSTAVLIGKGLFQMTVSGNKVVRHLSYMEVFIKRKNGWMALSLYASVIPA